MASLESMMPAGEIPVDTGKILANASELLLA
jgi:hypothetical protein